MRGPRRTMHPLVALAPAPSGHCRAAVAAATPRLSSGAQPTAEHTPSTPPTPQSAPPASLDELTTAGRLLVLDWAPQNDLLGQPNTVLFVAHGGINGLHEGAYHGVPMLVIPTIVDQPVNALMVESSGNGRFFDKPLLNGANGTAAVLPLLRELLSNPSYR
jgi:hypothetical protein